MTKARTNTRTKKLRAEPEIDTIDADQTTEMVEAEADQAAQPDPQSGFSVFNIISAEKNMMSAIDAAKLTAALTAEAKEKAKAERDAAKAVKAAEKIAAQAAAQAERDAVAAVKASEKAAAQAAKEARAAEREAKRAERKAHVVEYGVVKMAALRTAKDHYVKSATGQLRSSDELATVLDAVPPNNVIVLAISLLGLPGNPYANMNTGQQSMNLRNKLRGAIRRNVLTIAQVEAARDAGGYALSAAEIAASAPKPRAAKAVSAVA